MIKAFLFCLISINYVLAATEKLPLPRFASIRSNKVNVHVGPGKTYPIEWTYTRQGLPVEIIAEFDTWRQIKDKEGSASWVHKSLLSGKRTAMVKDHRHRIRSKPKNEARVVAYLEPDVIVKVNKCDAQWCQVDANGYTGWLMKTKLWGVYPHEEKM